MPQRRGRPEDSLTNRGRAGVWYATLPAKPHLVDPRKPLRKEGRHEVTSTFEPSDPVRVRVWDALDLDDSDLIIDLDD